MKIIEVEQDTPEWEAERRGRVGGSDSRGIMPPTRGTGDPSGFWDIIGERLTAKREDTEEKPMDRGHRLEDDGIAELETIVGLKFRTKHGIWRSDDEEMLQLSPDADEDSDEPTYAGELKSLKAGKHFRVLYAQKFSGLTGIDLVPNEYGSYYREQCIEYFVVNQKLEILFFAMYLPEAIYPEHRMIVITIPRESIEDEIAEQAETMKKQTARIRRIVEQLAGDNF